MITQPTPQSSMYDVLLLKEEINNVAEKSIKNEKAVFRVLTLRTTILLPPELGFLRTISWLYALYFESGKVNVEFLTDRFFAFGLDTNGDLINHLDDVNRLRTYLQHNLDPSSKRNLYIQEQCEEWFGKQCGSRVPGSDEHWQSCLLAILNHAKNFLKALRDCIRSIEKDDSREQIINDWEFRLKRYHPPHEFDRLIAVTATDMGRENLDVEQLRLRFYNSWVRDLKLLQGDYDFEIEARKMIEHALIVETTPSPPIIGRDIIEIFGIEPGPKVGVLVKQAHKLYLAEPCTREILLERVRILIESGWLESSGPE